MVEQSHTTPLSICKEYLNHPLSRSSFVLSCSVCERLSCNLIIRTVTTKRGGIEGVLATYGMRTQGALAPTARESASSPSREEADRDQDFHF